MVAPLTVVQDGLVVFWAVWLSVVLLTNVGEALKALRVLPGGWAFASENLELIAEATAVYSVPGWVNAALFGGVVLWQATAVALMWRAVGRLVAGVAPPGVDLALGTSIGLWAAFMVADEVLRAYRQQGSHVQLLIAQLLTLLVEHL